PRSTVGHPPARVRASESTGPRVACPRPAASSAAVVHGAQRSALQSAWGGVRHTRASFGTGGGTAAPRDTPPYRTHDATARSRAVAARSATRSTAREHRSGTPAPPACTTSVATDAVAEPRHAPRSAAVAQGAHPRPVQAGAGGGAPQVRVSLRRTARGSRGTGQLGAHAAGRRPPARPTRGGAP